MDVMSLQHCGDRELEVPGGPSRGAAIRCNVTHGGRPSSPKQGTRFYSATWKVFPASEREESFRTVQINKSKQQNKI
jgi:hypothetical protein